MLAFAKAQGQREALVHFRARFNHPLSTTDVKQKVVQTKEMEMQS
jgi:hypothetical protein